MGLFKCSECGHETCYVDPDFKHCLYRCAQCHTIYVSKAAIKKQLAQGPRED